MGLVAQRPEARDVVGVQVRVNGLDQLQVEFPYELFSSTGSTISASPPRRLASK
jgi:hypothetical protein